MSEISKTTINLPKDLKKELKKIAIDEETSLSGLIIKMIEEGMKNRTKTDVFQMKIKLNLQLNLTNKLQIEI